MATQPNKFAWRSLDEVIDSSSFAAWRHDEWPLAPFDETERNHSRRGLLKLAAASFLLSVLPGCSRDPDHTVVPHVHAPRGQTTGKPTHFASTFTRGREAIGVLVKSFDGRPIKVEGNPNHPASLGATDTFCQSEVLTLCDPSRSQSVLLHGEPRSWDAFEAALRDRLTATAAHGDWSRLRLLTGEIVSPTVLDQIARLLKRYPGVRWHVHEPLTEFTGGPVATRLQGALVEPVYHFDRAKIIASFDCDFLFALPGSVRYARHFSNGRRVNAGLDSMSRLYHAEPSPTLTGVKADHRRIASRGDLESLVGRLAARLGVGGTIAEPATNDAWIEALASDLKANRGSGLALAGPTLSDEAHRLVLEINRTLGNLGATVEYRPQPAAVAGVAATPLSDLIRDASAGGVDLLLTLDTNPAFTAGNYFAAAARSIDFTAHLGLFVDETASACAWHLPMTHALESWGDAVAVDGTASPIQPLIAPLYAGRSTSCVLSLLLDESLKSDFDLVQGFWRTRRSDDFDAWWNRSLATGVFDVPKTNASATDSVKSNRGGDILSPRADVASGSLSVLFRPSSSLWDGRFYRNAWLQELPDPITKIVWDNAAWISPTTAGRLSLRDEQLIDIHAGDRFIRIPVFIVPGQADDVLTLPLGYGEVTSTDHPAVGVNVWALRPNEDSCWLHNVEVRATGEMYPLATTQHHGMMEGRDLLRTTTFRDTRDAKPSTPKTVPLSLFPDRLEAPQQWGMSIDLASCIGCNACTIACQSENNIVSVGKEEVAKGREMHWIRIDRYFDGEANDPAIQHQPVPCMHCEQAPCEVVCPVGATQHSEDGLNDMVYNRCVGTRYCSNNCPYKVRRFNFLQYVDVETESLKIGRNPDVTVRSRGVMEKCTYCVQRIRGAQIEARIGEGDGHVADGAIQTACQQVCPTQAIIFGDVRDPTSHVSKLKANALDYVLLEELGTRPRTSYLKDVRNPHPSLARKDGHA